MFYITDLKTFCESNKVDDDKRNEGLVTPEGIRRFDNIAYGAHERQLLDVYRPENTEGSLPVIVSIHGGGWVYGNKEIMQFYCMSLAEHGFAVVNFSYRLAPEHRHPAMLEDVNSVFSWVLDHGAEYGFDTANVFAVGDSIGATMLGLYCCICNGSANPEVLEYPVRTPEGFLPKGLGLNCGLYNLVRGEELLIDDLASAYLPEGGTEGEFRDISILRHVSAAFPPSFVMTATEDFLAPQAKPFYDKLQSLGVPSEYRCYGDSEKEPAHVFHINIKLPVAGKCNDEQCAFFKRLTEV
ncbi:MAG: alpha/beta hydrolase [Lachnospiraceae bacterium]|nr:alpha/beta hydrolase [Lachnospiraceae bacterium]